MQQQHSGGFASIHGTNQNNQYRNRTFNGRFTFDLGRVQLEARAWDASGNNQYYNFKFNNSPPYNFLGFDPVSKNFHDQILALEARGKITQWWQTSLTFSHSQTHFDQVETYQPTHVARPEVDWHNVIAAGQHNRVSFGARFQNQRLFQYTGFSTIHQNVAEDYGYVQDELNYGAHHAVAAVSYLHNGRFGERFNWNLSYGYDLFAGTRLIASAGSAFRAPTLVDLYYPGASNPNLQPEKALDYEVAVRQQLGAAQDVELRLFRTDVRDLIIFNGTSFKPENTARARMQGVQLTWRYAGKNWNAQLRGIYQNARNRSTHTQLVRRPRFSVSARVDRYFKRFNIGAAVYSTGQRPDVDLLTGATGPAFADGGYALFDIHAGVKLTQNLELQAHVDNIFNHHYQTVHGYNQAGAAVYGTLRYTLPL
ncbi:MAG: TonB-dependent receptor [Sinobacteraceae bacterium]|nr:TonB-dependent receptor [Nevskiaceae bacterium]